MTRTYPPMLPLSEFVGDNTPSPDGMAILVQEKMIRAECDAGFGYKNFRDKHEFRAHTTKCISPAGKLCGHKKDGTPVLRKTTYARWGCVKIRDRDGKTKSVQAGQVLFYLVTGCEIPAGYEIDHIDKNPLNNSLDNLRLATSKEQKRNRSNAISVQSEHQGVSWSKRCEIWVSTLSIKRGSSRVQHFHIGAFDCEHVAGAEYRRIRYHYEQNGVFLGLSPLRRVRPRKSKSRKSTQVTNVEQHTSA